MEPVTLRMGLARGAVCLGEPALPARPQPALVSPPRRVNAPRRPMAKKQYEWKIIRLRAKGEFLGYVEASDEKAAIEAAIK
jgi:hypothetical protein